MTPERQIIGTRVALSLSAPSTLVIHRNCSMNFRTNLLINVNNHDHSVRNYARCIFSFTFSSFFFLCKYLECL